MSATSDPDAGSRRRPRWSERPRALRVGTYVVLGLVLVLVATTVLAAGVVRRSLPEVDGSLALPGLDADVVVRRDAAGVPQIYGETTEDLLRAQGFVHAQERFFEMDVRRHATAGRLAELFGEDAVESDAYVRTMGWRRVAERELAMVSPATRDALTAYAEGVNAYLDDRSLGEISLEYTVLDVSGLDYRPADWTPVDSLAWLKAMAWDLRGNMTEEVERVLAADAVGPARADQLWPDYPYATHPPVVDQGAVVDGVFEQDATAPGTREPQRPGLPDAAAGTLGRTAAGLARMPAWLGSGDGIGSNAWVVSGEHTATGGPLLANDPHLGVSLPGVWMQVGLHCTEVSEACPLDVSGFGFSGVPGVVIGQNADLAWGFTNLGPDVADLYVERVRGTRWRYAGELRPLRLRTETIEVAGGDDVELTIRETAHGPLLSDVDDTLASVAAQRSSRPRVPGAAGAAGEDYAVSLAWTALEPRPTADALLALNTAGDWEEFRAALEDFAVPGQNVVYADREGHIGYQATGRVPIRKTGNDGLVPAAGWRPENDWTGEYVPYDGLPSVLDPDDGVLVSANQAPLDPRRGPYPYFLGEDWDLGYRATRIAELIDQRADEGGLRVADMSALQLDDRHPAAAVLVPHLLDVDLPAGYWSDGQELLADWDFSQPAESGAAAYFNVVWRTLLRRTFDDELPEASRPDGGARWVAVVEELLERPEDPWWDDLHTEDVVETRDDVLEAALRSARDELTSRQALDPAEWRWGRLHVLDLRSSTLGSSGNPVLEQLFNADGWEVGGGSAAVNATGWDAREGYQVGSAPSMRMVASLAEPDDSRWVNLTGVSGHAFSPHYTDQTELWVRGETLAWPVSEDAVRAATEDVLVLEPSGD